jgi:hypothetical protein
MQWQYAGQIDAAIAQAKPVKEKGQKRSASGLAIAVS